MTGAFVEVWRGHVVESRHAVSIAVADPAGRVRAVAGNAELVSFARSAVKPVQALPLVEDGGVERFGLGPAELALCCASHSGEAGHVRGVRSILRKVGAREEDLACGATQPLGAGAQEEPLERGAAPERIHNSCSGKHAGMLGLARLHGWPMARYQEPSHPVQRRMLEEVSTWTRVPRDDVAIAVDGCGVATFALPLSALAGAFARLAAAARRGEGAAAQVMQAIARAPWFLGGTGRLCTDLVEAAGGRIIAKGGAEGVYCAGVPGAELGIALKVEDGAGRAAGPALLAVLRVLGLLSEDEMAQLAGHAEPDRRNTRGEVVGGIRAVVRLQSGHGR